MVPTAIRGVRGVIHPQVVGVDDGETWAHERSIRSSIRADLRLLSDTIGVSKRMHQVQGAITGHLRASGEPVRESALYERVSADGVDVTGEDFIAVLLRLEVEGHLRIDAARDDRVAVSAPLEQRYWRITE